jgi:hypothetical protein
MWGVQGLPKGLSSDVSSVALSSLIKHRSQIGEDLLIDMKDSEALLKNLDEINPANISVPTFGIPAYLQAVSFFFHQGPMCWLFSRLYSKVKSSVLDTKSRDTSALDYNRIDSEAPVYCVVEENSRFCC